MQEVSEIDQWSYKKSWNPKKGFEQQKTHEKRQKIN